MSALKIFHDDYEYIIAESPEDATAVMREHNGPNFDPGVTWEEFTAGWSVMADDEEFTWMDSPEPIVKTAAEWCAEKGRGWFATSEHG